MYYDSVLHYHVLTEMKLKAALKPSCELLKANIKSTLKEKSAKYGWHWAKAVYLFYSEILHENLQSIYEEFIRDISEGDSVNTLHLTQVFKDHLNYDYVQNKFDAIGDVVVLNGLINCDEIDVQIAEVFSKIEKIRSKDVPQFLYNS